MNICRLNFAFLLGRILFFLIKVIVNLACDIFRWEMDFFRTNWNYYSPPPSQSLEVWKFEGLKLWKFESFKDWKLQSLKDSKFESLKVTQIIFNFRSRKRTGPNPFCSCCRSHPGAQASRPPQENWKLWMQPKNRTLWSSTSKWKSWGTTNKWKCWGNSKKRKPTQTESRKPPWIVSTVNSEWQYI